MSLESAVTAALAVDGGPVTERDKATVELALAYARDLDAGGDITKVGPHLLAALDALLLTPRSRAAALRKGTPGEAASRSPLDELRARRARRNGTEAVDSAAT